MLIDFLYQFNDFAFDLSDKGFESMFFWGIFFVIVGLLIFVSSIYLVSKNKGYSDNLLDAVISQEIVNSLEDVKNEKIVEPDKQDNEIVKVIMDEKLVDDDFGDKVDIDFTGEIASVKISDNISSDKMDDDISASVIKEDENDIILEDFAFDFDNNYFDDDVKDTDDMEIVEVSDNNIEVNKDENNSIDEFFSVDDFESDDAIDYKDDYDDSKFKEIEDVPEVVVNKDIDVFFPNEVKIEIKHPVKGKNVIVDLSDDEEEIELL